MNYLYLLLPMFSIYFVGLLYPIDKEAERNSI